jgi:hypothetical protein
MSLFHGIKYIDSNGTVHGFIDNAGSPQICAQDYLQALAEGDITGHTPFAKYGIVTGVGDTAKDVWEYGATQAAYVFPASAAKMRVVSSSTDDDGSPAGIGTQKIKIEGLTSDYSSATEEVTMDGTTPVETTTEFLRVNRSYVSAGTPAVGNIKVYHLTNATPIYSYISLGFTQSRACIYTVPLGKTLYITSVRYSAGVGGNAIKLNFCRFTNRATVDPGTGAVSTIWYPFNEIGIVQQAFFLPLEMPTKIPATADLKISVIGDYASGATNCTAALRGWTE